MNTNIIKQSNLNRLPTEKCIHDIGNSNWGFCKNDYFTPVAHNPEKVPQQFVNSKEHRMFILEFLQPKYFLAIVAK